MQPEAVASGPRRKAQLEYAGEIFGADANAIVFDLDPHGVRLVHGANAKAFLAGFAHFGRVLRVLNQVREDLQRLVALDSDGRNVPVFADNLDAVPIERGGGHFQRVFDKFGWGDRFHDALVLGNALLLRDNLLGKKAASERGLLKANERGKKSAPVSPADQGVTNCQTWLLLLLLPHSFMIAPSVVEPAVSRHLRPRLLIRRREDLAFRFPTTFTSSVP